MHYTEKELIALIFGGRGYEREVSVKGAEFVYSLACNGTFSILPIYIEKSGKWLMRQKDDDKPSPSELATNPESAKEVYPIYRNDKGGLLVDDGFIPIVAAIPLLHGDFGEDGIVQGALECAKIPYVGCDVCASGVARDKSYVKAIARHIGIPTADWIVADKDPIKGSERVSLEIGYPAFIKPCRLGSSVGASVIRCDDELTSALDKSREFSERIIIEKYIKIKKELECAYFSADGKELFTNSGEISYTESFYDYERKYTCTPDVGVSAAASLRDEQQCLIKQYSERLVHELGVRDLARIDFFETEDGKILFNEINTFPGFTSTSLYPRLVENHGIAPRELIHALIKQCIKRGA